MKTTEEQDRHFIQFLKDMRCSRVPVKPKTGKLVHATIIIMDRFYLLQQGAKNLDNEEGQKLKDQDPVLI